MILRIIPILFDTQLIYKNLEIKNLYTTKLNKLIERDDNKSVLHCVKGIAYISKIKWAEKYFIETVSSWGT